MCVYTLLYAGKRSVLTGGSVRKYLLVTLSHAELTSERKSLSAEILISRLKDAFICKSIIVSKENHVSRGGFHYHIGVWNENASRYTMLSKMRELFPEFEGNQLNVSPHKGWNSVCKYLLKEDKTPTVWGEESLSQVQDRARSAESKRRGPDLVKLLREKESWNEVMCDDNLVKKCMSSYSSVRSTFEDLISLKRNVSCFESAFAFWQSMGKKAVYAYSELNERYFALIWLVCNVCLKRHLRQKQLLILGRYE